MLTGGWEGGQADYARVVFGAHLPAASCIAVVILKHTFDWTQLRAQH